jgi:hypothetical protein
MLWSCVLQLWCDDLGVLNNALLHYKVKRKGRFLVPDSASKD